MIHIINKIIEKIDAQSIKYYYGTMIEPNNQKYRFMSDFFSTLSKRVRKLIT